MMKKSPNISYSGMTPHTSLTTVLYHVQAYSYVKKANGLLRQLKYPAKVIFFAFSCMTTVSIDKDFTHTQLYSTSEKAALGPITYSCLII